MQKSAEDRVDAFVAAVNQCRRDRLLRAEIPDACCVEESNDFTGDFDWRIVPSAGASWLPELEAQSPFPWPPTFRTLISRYLFPSFVCGPLRFFSVGVTDPEGDWMELRTAVFQDEYLVPVLWKYGYLPFARPQCGSYDPICFACGNASPGTEPAIVGLSHEAALCYHRAEATQPVSEGFDYLLEEMTYFCQKSPDGLPRQS